MHMNVYTEHGRPQRAIITLYQSSHSVLKHVRAKIYNHSFIVDVFMICEDEPNGKCRAKTDPF